MVFVRGITYMGAIRPHCMWIHGHGLWIPCHGVWILVIPIHADLQGPQMNEKSRQFIHCQCFDRFTIHGRTALNKMHDPNPFILEMQQSQDFTQRSIKNDLSRPGIMDWPIDWRGHSCRGIVKTPDLEDKAHGRSLKTLDLLDLLDRCRHITRWNIFMVDHD